MVEPAHLVRSRILESLARDLHALSFDSAEPSLTTGRSDRLTAEAERIAAAVRAQFRG